MDKTTVQVELVIEHDAKTDAERVVNKALDGGVFQDTINDWNEDGLEPRVVSAMVRAVSRGEGGCKGASVYLHDTEATRDELRQTFNRLRAEDRIPALNAVVKLLSVRELDAIVLGYAGAPDKAIDDAEHARKRATKIRESYLASVRANVNLLASMTATERFNVIPNLAPDVWARGAARALMVETWGEDAVAAALGGGS